MESAGTSLTIAFTYRNREIPDSRLDMIAVLLGEITLPFYRSGQQGSVSVGILQWVTKPVGGSVET